MIPALFVGPDLWILQNPRLTFDGVRSRDYWEHWCNDNPLAWDECSLSEASEWERN